MMRWDYAGKQNTGQTVRCAVERGKDLGIIDFVIASNTGDTIDFFLRTKEEIWPDAELNVVAVTHQVGFREPGGDEMGQDKRRQLRERGVCVHTATHLFGNVERAVTREWGGLHPGGLIAQTLRTFGEGMKVCFEVAIMAKDAGLIPHGQEIISLGGTSRGADTAVVMKPAHGHNFFDTELLEVVCRPRGRSRKR